MWQNNGFGSNGTFQNNFNQEELPSSPFGGGSTGPLNSQQLFPQQQQSNMMQYDDTTGNGFMNNNFRPEVGLFNENNFMQNQFTPQTQFSPPIFSLPPTMSSNTPRPTTQINARAAELKAQLLKGREARVGSSTPPVPKPVLPTKHAIPVEASSSLRGSPKTLKPANEHREQEININELISQYSDTKSAADAIVKKATSCNIDNVVTSLQRNPAHSAPRAKSQAPSLGSPTKVTKPVINGKKSPSSKITKQNSSGHTSNGSISEGEILEDTPKEPSQPTEPKKVNVPASIEDTNQDEQLSRSLRDQISRPSHSRIPRDASPRRGASKAQSQRPEIDRHEEPSRADRQSDEQDSRRERKSYFEPERDSYSRRGSLDEYRNHEPRPVPRDDEPRRPSRKEQPPTLADVLPHDNNLREWLDITGFHNAPYRDNVLSKHRLLAQLDAQRLRLIADLEAERRQGAPASLSSAMLPPPLPNSTALEAPLATIQTTSDIRNERTVTNKRPYSEVEDEGPSVKLARTDTRSQEMRIRDEDEYDRGYSRSNGHTGPRRTSIDYREDRPPSRARCEDDRVVRGRESSREREISPGRRAFENRPPARFRPYDSDDSRDRDEFEERPKRPYEVRGSYRGRAFDPNYRGRGRGRGRGDFQTQAEVKSEPNFGSRIATGKPFKDFRGYDRGGKGDTRYFIVKSFNEENVLKCIEDSIWTTQLQNGCIFKEAFETCKNVILVFSINKSRAFQGYARMESLPGSVEIPAWQRSINWESTGAFKVRWLVVCATKFGRIGHLKNALNDNQAVLIGKDGQEIEENCGAKLIELIDEEATETLAAWKDPDEVSYWDD